MIQNSIMEEHIADLTLLPQSPDIHTLLYVLHVLCFTLLKLISCYVVYLFTST